MTPIDILPPGGWAQLGSKTDLAALEADLAATEERLRVDMHKAIQRQTDVWLATLVGAVLTVLLAAHLGASTATAPSAGTE